MRPGRGALVVEEAPASWVTLHALAAPDQSMPDSLTLCSSTCGAEALSSRQRHALISVGV